MVLDSIAEFRPEIRQVGELVERGVQMIYLIATLLPHIKPEFISIIRIKADNIHIFRSATSCPNIVYSIIKYKEDRFRRGDIVAICQLVNNKLEEYLVLAKIIIYNSSIITI